MKKLFIVLSIIIFTFGCSNNKELQTFNNLTSEVISYYEIDTSYIHQDETNPLWFTIYKNNCEIKFILNENLSDFESITARYNECSHELAEVMYVLYPKEWNEFFTTYSIHYTPLKDGFVVTNYSKTHKMFVNKKDNIVILLVGVKQ